VTLTALHHPRLAERFGPRRLFARRAADEAAAVLRRLALAYDEADCLRVLGPLRDFAHRAVPLPFAPAAASGL